MHRVVFWLPLLFCIWNKKDHWDFKTDIDSEARTHAILQEKAWTEFISIWPPSAALKPRLHFFEIRKKQVTKFHLSVVFAQNTHCKRSFHSVVCGSLWFCSWIIAYFVNDIWHLSFFNLKPRFAEILNPVLSNFKKRCSLVLSAERSTIFEKKIFYSFDHGDYVDFFI